MNVEAILSRLDRVHPNGKDRWTACCPAHDDKSPSLSIRDAADRVLLHCFGGCTADAICSAIGIGLHDLFADGRAPRQLAPGVSLRSLADAMESELLICACAANSRANGRSLSVEDLKREALAWERIERGREALRRAAQ